MLDLKSQVRGTIKQVISEGVLPTIRDSFGKLGTDARTKMDLASSEQHRSPM